MILQLLNELKVITKKSIEDDVSVPFNIVIAISDTYYRENLHSQVLGFMLKESDYNIQLCKYLNRYFAAKINLLNYTKFSITNEIDGRIDLLIKSEESKHCIIFENKINNANDMPRQIPRYVKHMVGKGYLIDAIVYFSINGLKDIDKTTWTDDDHLIMEGRPIISIAAVGDTDNSFINGFLKPAIKSQSKLAEVSYLSQYIDLLEYLGREELEKAKMSEFYNVMMINDNFSTAISVRDMINEMCKYRRDRLYEFFLNDKSPFDRIGTYSSNITLFYGIKKITDETVKIDLICSDKETVLYFWVQEPKNTNDLIGEILNSINEMENFKKEEINAYKRSFRFPYEEEELYQYIRYLLSKIDEYVEEKQVNSTTKCNS